MLLILGAPCPGVAAGRITPEEPGATVEFERERVVRECCIEEAWARVRARRSEERCRARSSAEGGSPKMKNLIRRKMMRKMESWPRRKPWVKDAPLGYGQ